VIPVPRQIDAKGPDARAVIDGQAQLVNVVDQLNRIPLLDGRQIGPIVLAAGVTKDIVHGLGRTLRGWIIVRVGYSGATAVVQEASGNPDEALFLRLSCAQAVTLSLWVF
jgi:hypothetical protein